MLQPAQRQRRAQPLALRRRVDTDDVDLTDRLVCVVVRMVLLRRGLATMGFRPVETDQLAVRFGEEEPASVEPRLLLAHHQIVERPRALVRVVGERAVVDLEPRLLVLSDDKRAYDDLRWPRRRGHGSEQRPAHLPQHAFALEPHRPGQIRRAGAGAVRPQPQPRAVGRLGNERLDQLPAVALAAMTRADRELRTRAFYGVGGVRVRVADALAA